MKLSFTAVAVAAALVMPAASPSLPAYAASMMAMKPQPKTWTVGDLVISGAFSRATLPNAPVAGGYFTITNKGSVDDTLTSASSPAAGSVQLHAMAMQNGVMKMQELPEGVAVPAGKTVSLTPDGLHLMFTDLKQRFVKGKTVPVTLTFAKAGSVTLDLVVGDIAAKAPAADSMSNMKM
jgi:copper(I)-binding protein